MFIINRSNSVNAAKLRPPLSKHFSDSGILKIVICMSKPNDYLGASPRAFSCLLV